MTIAAAIADAVVQIVRREQARRSCTEEQAIEAIVARGPFSREQIKMAYTIANARR